MKIRQITDSRNQHIVAIEKDGELRCYFKNSSLHTAGATLSSLRRDIANHEVLAEVAAGVGMAAARAREVLASGAFANEVREAEEFFRRNGINSVPAVIIEKKHLVSGGQPPEVFERALREIAAAP